MIFKPKHTDHYTDLHGGSGQVTISRHLESDDTAELGLIAKITVEKGGSIGYHQHQDDSEAYFILSGQATFIDADGQHKDAGPDDLCLITKGQSHGIINEGDTPLEFLAIVF